MKQNIIIIIGITFITTGIIMFAQGQALAIEHTWTPGDLGMWNAFFGLAPIILGAGLVFAGAVEKASKNS